MNGNLLALAIGWIAAWCVHTPQGRELAKKAASEVLKQAGTAEGEIAKAVKQAVKKPKGEEPK